MIKVGFEGECKNRIRYGVWKLCKLDHFLNWIIEDVELCEMKDKAFSII